MLETLTTLLQPWADLYGDNHTLSTGIIAAHVLAMFVGGGLALGADRRVLLSTPGTPDAHRAAAADLGGHHRLIIGALVLVVASGLLLAAADIGTYAVSPVYWAKMATFMMLAVNGVLMQRAEARIVHAATGTMDLAAAGPELSLPWRALRRSAWISLAGWLTTVFLGVLLTNN